MSQNNPIDSTGFKKTTIIPALELPIPPKQNIIWCSSFQLAWNKVAPIHIENLGKVIRFLNQTNVSEKDLEVSSYRVNATFLNTDRLVLDAFLTAELQFEHPFQNLRTGMDFIDSDGNKNRVKGFGIPYDQSNSMGMAPFQVEVLYKDAASEEFILDLSSRTKPYQLIVAKIDLLDNLADTIGNLNSLISEQIGRGFLIPGNSLSVPNMDFHIQHNFRELESGLIETARQRVKFKLDRFGAKLESHAELKLVGVGSGEYNLDRPFLIIMKKRDRQRPFFVTWVDNAELFKPM